MNPHAYGQSNGGGGGGGKGSGSNVHSFHDLESEESAPIHRDKFLAKLPVSVINDRVSALTGQHRKYSTVLNEHQVTAVLNNCICFACLHVGFPKLPPVSLWEMKI
eukprot:965573-Pelagomonas_calceolata.AAC.8